MSEGRRKRRPPPEDRDLDRARQERPGEQPDFQRVKEFIEGRKAGLTRYLAIHGWVKRWLDNWEESRERFFAEPPGSPAWHIAGVQALAVMAMLAKFNRVASLWPNSYDKRLPKQGSGRKLKVEATIAKLVVWRLLSGPEKDPASTAELSLGLSQVISGGPYPSVPWSYPAIAALAKSQGWGKHLKGEIQRDGAPAHTVPDLLNSWRLPSASDFWDILNPLFTVGRSTLDPKDKPHAGILLQNLSLASDLVSRTLKDPDAVERLRKPDARGNARLAAGIGAFHGAELWALLDRRVGQVTFKPIPFYVPRGTEWDDDEDLPPAVPRTRIHPIRGK